MEFERAELHGNIQLYFPSTAVHTLLLSSVPIVLLSRGDRMVQHCRLATVRRDLRTLPAQRLQSLSRRPPLTTQIYRPRGCPAHQRRGDCQRDGDALSQAWPHQRAGGREP